MRLPGLGWYAYGARFYDPAIGSFTGVDPIAEEFAWVNPFNYAENEPIANIDLHGLQKVNNGALRELQKEGNSLVNQARNSLNNLYNSAKSLFTGGSESNKSADKLRGGYEVMTGVGRFAGRVLEDPVGTSSGIIDALPVPGGEKAENLYSKLEGAFKLGEAIGEAVVEVGKYVKAPEAKSSSEIHVPELVEIVPDASPTPKSTPGKDTVKVGATYKYSNDSTARGIVQYERDGMRKLTHGATVTSHQPIGVDRDKVKEKN